MFKIHKGSDFPHLPFLFFAFSICVTTGKHKITVLFILSESRKIISFYISLILSKIV